MNARSGGPPEDLCLVDLAERFLRESRAGEFRGPSRERLAGVSPDHLADLDQRERLAFWIDVYNATAHATLRVHPERFENRRRFFSRPIVTIAGTRLSLDEIEHGILRRARWKYGLGYIPHPFPSRFVRRHLLPELDYRIHFALNCGAASCPAVVAYSAGTVDEQLDRATAGYLASETIVRSDAVYVPRLLLWYRGDFGGRSGISELLREFDVIEPDERPRIRYREYDWTLAVGAVLGGEPQS